MLSGYEMATSELRSALPQWPERPERETWGFQAIAPAVKREAGHELAHAELLRQLKVSGSRALKVWKLSAALKVVAVGAMAAAMGAAYFFWPAWLPVVLLVLGVYAAAVAAVGALHRVTGTGKSFTAVGTGLFMVPLGALAAAVHLAVFDRL